MAGTNNRAGFYSILCISVDSILYQISLGLWTAVSGGRGVSGPVRRPCIGSAVFGSASSGLSVPTFDWMEGEKDPLYS